MEVSGRDRAIVQFVARFKQATPKQIDEVLFAANKSKSPCYRRLEVLTEQGYLRKIEYPARIGGSRGGSGQNVYSLGRRGHFMFKDGDYHPARRVDYHALQIVEVYLLLHRLHVAGRLVLVGFATEPDCWLTIAGVEHKCDGYVELADMDGRQMKLILEIDMGTEGQKQIIEKLMKYYRSYEVAENWPYRRIVWIAVDEERRLELDWLLKRGTEEQRNLFNVMTLQQFGEQLAPGHA